jgi:iron complex transport system substrate-binding protein
MRQFLRSLLVFLPAFAIAPAFAQETPQRVVTLSGSLTEIVYALNAQETLVGVDQSSSFPAPATQLPQVGYYRNFSVEGVAALKPTLVLANDQAGPPEAIARLQQLGPRVVVLPSAATVEALEGRIRGVARELGASARGERLIAAIRASLASTATSKAPRALLLMGRDSHLQGAGRNTAADSMLRLTGAENVLATQEGYKPISPEALAALAPEVIITTRMTVESVGGEDKLMASPGIALTPAAKQGRIIVMDDLLLLGFGPRLPEALSELRAGFAGAAQIRR